MRQSDGIQPAVTSTSARVGSADPTYGLIALAVALVMLVHGCGLFSAANRPDLPLLRFNNQRQAVTSDLSSLGVHVAGEVLRIELISSLARAAYILEPDAQRGDTAVIVGGGKPGAPFFYRVTRSGELWLFVDVPMATALTDVRLGFGPVNFQPAPTQPVLVQFLQGYLSDGLFDPARDTPDDQAFLAAIEPTVRAGIIERLREIYAGTGVEILTLDDDMPAEFSILALSPQRVLAQGGELDALPVAGCADQVIFGEVLPGGEGIDAGNQNRNDQGIVFVGSFRGRGDCDPGLVVNSTTNIINALALAAAHEIGHLVGLNHSALDGLMSPSPSLSVSRQIGLERSQIVIDVGRGEEVITSVVQDPRRYFDSIFGRQ